MKYELLLRTKMVLILFKRFWNLKFSSQNPLKKLWIKEKNNKKASSPLLSKYCIVECFNYWIIINVTYWLFWSVLVGISVRTKEQMKSPWSLNYEMWWWKVCRGYKSDISRGCSNKNITDNFCSSSTAVTIFGGHPL